VEKPVNILIADDEPPARDELAYLVGQAWPTAQIHQARTGAEAIAACQSVAIDVAFLDINMPAGTGLEVAARLAELAADGLKRSPYVVFATAYSEHAVEAFHLAALDYLVKPYDERRLQKTLSRVLERLAKGGPPLALQTVIDDHMAGKIWGETESDDNVLLHCQDIAFVEADRKRVYAVMADGTRARVKLTLKELEGGLGTDFLRIHKGYLLNLKYLSRAERWPSGGYSLRLNDKARSELQVSRRYAATFKCSAGLH
jgi:DNA-binding LytR/AlgR family response regulator